MTGAVSRALAPGTTHSMGITDKISGKVKQAVGDATDNPDTRREGQLEERKAEAKDERARAEERVENLEERT